MKKMVFFIFCITSLSLAQINSRLRIEHIHYRPAIWDTVNIKEEPYEVDNKGGYVFIYFRNPPQDQQVIRGWRWNRFDDSQLRLSGRIAWDRNHHSVAPGELGVLEICGISEDFAPGRTVDFSFIDGNWRSTGFIRDTLLLDPVCVSFIRVSEDLTALDVHIANRGDLEVDLKSFAIEGRDMESLIWSTTRLAAHGHAIARTKLAQPFIAGSLIVIKLEIVENGKSRKIYSHRRAHADRFPIGTWGAEKKYYGLVRQHHIETIVKGGTTNDAFYSSNAAKYGFRTMVHTGVYPNAKVLQNLGEHPVVHCWMVQDEPDWHQTPQMIFTSVETTHQLNSRKPTMITLCRNGKFFEYAFLPDIPAQDHYSVTAPSSSIWKQRYGTRLEETAIYTADLKRAAEPKPVWIWSQGIADWDERPKRPVPTVDELSAQLLLNLGRGAKGLLWFNFEIEPGEKYPDLRQAIQQWNRVLRMTREDLISAEPVEAHVKASQLLDVAVLVSWDKLFIFIVNKDYDINDQAYQWRPVKNAGIELTVPAWIEPQSVNELNGSTPLRIHFKKKGRSVSLFPGNIDVCKFLVLDADKKSLAKYTEAFEKIVAEEKLIER